MKAVPYEVVVKEGSNVTLTCRGHNVERQKTRIIWKFNGHEMPGNTNKEEKFLNDEKTGNFSLYIKNVSRKDVGNYTCLAKVADIDKTNDDEDNVKLSLDKKGEFHLLLLLLYNIPFNRSTTQQVTLS